MSTYRERLVAPPSWWIVVVAFGLVWGWIMLVASNLPIAIGTAILATVVTGALVWSYGSVVVAAGPDGLHVGAAHLPAANVGNVEALDPPAFREWLGPKADARAWLKTRPYIESGVQVAVADPSDPAPYWLVSSRHPEALAEALRQTGDAAGAQGLGAPPAGLPVGDGRQEAQSNGEVHGGEEEV